MILRQSFSLSKIWSQFEKGYFEQNEWILSCSGFLNQRFGLCLREELLFTCIF